MPMGCEVRVVRGGIVDCVHEVAVAVAGADGSVVAQTPGAADRPVFLRSSAKPFQAAPAVAAGVLERLALDDRHLAVSCASHAGLLEHTARVAEILAAAGLGPGDLDNGDDGRGDPLQHNCSGNHALGLALCVVSGWPTAGYLEPAHPLQVAMRAAVADAAGVAAEEAVDGCGMRAYLLPLGRFAAMFGRLAGATDGPLARCADAMRAHPHLVRCDGEIDTELMRAEPGLVAKVGAEAVIGIGLRDGRGLAVKVLDGGWRALDTVAVHAGRAGLGLALATDALASHAAPPIVNARGVVVGGLHTRIELMRESTEI